MFGTFIWTMSSKSMTSSSVAITVDVANKQGITLNPRLANYHAI
jgi:hypothetical protein